MGASVADVFDQAQERDSLNLREAMAAQSARAAAAPRLLPVGHCLNPACGDDFPQPAANARLFCGPACSDEYQRRLRAA